MKNELQDSAASKEELQQKLQQALEFVSQCQKQLATAGHTDEEIQKLKSDLANKNAEVALLNQKNQYSNSSYKKRKEDLDLIRKLQAQINEDARDKKSSERVYASYERQKEDIVELKNRIMKYQEEEAQKKRTESTNFNETLPMDKQIVVFDTNWLINFGINHF